jgi:uncharacterized protein YjdB
MTADELTACLLGGSIPARFGAKVIFVAEAGAVCSFFNAIHSRSPFCPTESGRGRPMNCQVQWWLVIQSRRSVALGVSGLARRFGGWLPRSIAFFALFTSAFTVTAQQERGTLFGPRTFTGSTGQPKADIVSFTTGDFGPPFVLHVRNGDQKGKFRASSARIELDGKEIIGTSYFSRRVGMIDEPVDIADHAQLRVRIDAKPGCKLTLWIDGALLPTHAKISPRGGRYRFRGGTILDVPRGAVALPTDIQVLPVDSAAVNKLLANRPYSWNTFRVLGGFSGAPDGLQFNVPVKATFRVKPLAGSAEVPIMGYVEQQKGTLRLASADSRYRPNLGVVELEISHFSTLVTFGTFNPDVSNNDPCRSGPIRVETSSTDTATGNESGSCSVVSDTVSVTFLRCVPPFTESFQMSEASAGCTQPGTLTSTVVIDPPGPIYLDAPDVSGGTYTQTLRAKALDQNGQEVPDMSATWYSLNPAAATVGPSTGVVTAVARGVADIVARIEKAGAMTSVTVGRVKRVEVTPSGQAVNQTGTLQLQARAFDVTNQEIPGLDLLTDWSLVPAGTTLAKIERPGLLTALGEGTGTVGVVAEIQGVKNDPPAIVNIVDISDIDIEPVSPVIKIGDSITFTATPRDAEGNEVAGGLQVSWNVPGSAVQTCGTAGCYLGIQPGTATITAQVLDVAVSTDLTVVPYVVVQPPAKTISVGGTFNCSATAVDQNGKPLSPSLPVDKWEIDKPSVAALCTSGQLGCVIGVGSGTATITATIAGGKGSATITVGTTVVVNPPIKTIPVGSSFTFTATAVDANGNPLSLPVDKWETSDPATAPLCTSGPPGCVTGAKPGTATITATIAGYRGSATLTVRPQVTSVTVTPQRLAMPVGSTYQYSVVGKDATGAVVSAAADTWSTYCPGNSISSDGIL